MEAQSETKTYTLRDPVCGGFSKEIEAESLRDAEHYAREWAKGGDYGEIEKTIWVDTIVEDESGEVVSEVTTAIDPRPPECLDGERDAHVFLSPHKIVGGCKENPGVFANGGGVIIHEVCVLCGTERVTDTWAQRPDTGKQGLCSVRYEERRYVDFVGPGAVGRADRKVFGDSDNGEVEIGQDPYVSDRWYLWQGDNLCGRATLRGFEPDVYSTEVEAWAVAKGLVNEE